MKKSAKLFIVFLTAFVQGLCITVIPGSSFIYKAVSGHALSDEQYGIVFLPLIFGAVVINLFFKLIMQRLRPRIAFWASLFLHVLFILSWASISLTSSSNSLSFFLLSLSNLFLGFGFGLLLTFMNLIAVQLYPERRNIVLAGLHAIIGIGASLAPQVIRFFHQKNYWVGTAWLYLSFFCVIGFLIYISRIASEEAEKIHEHLDKVDHAQHKHMPTGAQLFLILLFFYGFIEGMVSNWCGVYLLEEKLFSQGAATSALSFFWLFITVGRILATVYAFRFDARWLFLFSPLVIMSGLFFMMMYKTEAMTFFVFLLIGLGCSYFFPLAVSLSTQFYDQWREKIASYALVHLMMGVGVGSALTGYLRNKGWISLEHGFLSCILACFVMLAILTILFYSKRSHARLALPLSR